MSIKTKYAGSKCLQSQIGVVTVYLFKGWDLTHGIGWFTKAYSRTNNKIGFGFHKTNKFTSVRQALILK